MNILVLDTSSEKFSLLIVKNNKIILNYSKILKRTYSKNLIPIIKKYLNKNKLQINKINSIFISLGPGSFTGIRIGIAAVKGISLPHKINVYGFSNMEILINSIRKDLKKKVVIILKSKKEDYYYQIFNSNKKPLKKISFFSLNDLPNFLFNKNFYLFGDLDKRLLSEIKKRRKMEIIEEKNLNTFLLFKQLKSKLLINKIKLLQPLYVYDHYAKK